jgi:hypothetical protein
LWGAHDDAVLSRHRYTRAEVAALLRGAGLDVLELTYANTLLFPVLALRRTLDRLTGRHGSDVSFLPAPFESAFRGLLRAEARMVRHVRLPFGASVLALGRKPRVIKPGGNVGVVESAAPRAHPEAVGSTASTIAP